MTEKIKLNIGNAKNPEWVKRGISPYKMFLSSYFKKMHLRRGHLIEQELERFKQLKNKISAIITTNYDLFLKHLFFPMTIQYLQTKLSFSIRIVTISLKYIKYMVLQLMLILLSLLNKIIELLMILANLLLPKC